MHDGLVFPFEAAYTLRRRKLVKMVAADYGVLIAGAGASGICMAVQLQRKLGFDDYLIVERGNTFGGTWHWNRYNGVACDIPTTLYSYSFAQQYFEDPWAAGEKLLGYFGKVAHAYGLQKKTSFRTELLGATWNEDKSYWEIELRNLESGQEYIKTAKVFLTAVGGLTNPNELKLPGKAEFLSQPGKEIVYTGLWKNTDMKNKNVVVLGNGCSGTQVVPAIVDDAKSVTQFGRSKHFYLPRPKIPNFPRLFKTFPFMQNVLRVLMFFLIDFDFRVMLLTKGKSRRAWYQKVSERHVRKTAPAEYHDVLIPDFEVGTKRRIFDKDYLAALNRPNVKFYFESPESFTKEGIKRSNGQVIPADVVVAATGFQVQNNIKSFFGLNVIGKDGISIADHTEDGASAYLGTFFSGFPSFAVILGPNTATGHSSQIFMAECVVDMVIRRIKPILNGSADSFEVKRSVEKGYMAWLRNTMKSTIWEQAKDGKSWYQDAAGRCTAVFCGSQTRFWFKTRTVRDDDFTYKNDKRYSKTWIVFLLASVAAAALASTDVRDVAKSFINQHIKTA